MRVPKQSSSRAVAHSSLSPLLSTLTMAVLTASLAACGGGGGGSPAGATPTEQQSNAAGSSDAQTGGSTGASATATFDSANPDSFYFAPAARYSDLSSFEADTGSGLYATWSPSGPAMLQSKGAKILFFGSGAGCAAGTRDGAVLAQDAAAALDVAKSFGLDASTVAHAWTPSGATAGCDSDVQGLSGRSRVALAAGSTDTSGNALAIRTYSGRGDADAPAFLLPIPATGQDGAGLNANITNTSVTFRQDWPAGTIRHPWAQSGQMLMHAQQAVSSIAMPNGLASGELAQSKQQLMATFVNSGCWANRAQYGHPCQVQLIFHTAIARTDSAAFPSAAKVWFDKAQGGMLIVSGLIPAAGSSMNDDSSSTPIYTSYGSATKHTAFSRTAFDVGVSIAQLRDILRIGTAQSLGTTKAAVTDDMLAATWGPTWSDPAAWALVTANATQEIYNNSAAGNAVIDGEYFEIYVGPKA